MSPRRPAPGDALGILAGLEPLFAADTVEAVLEQAVALLGGLTEAHATALLLTDGSSVVHEAWHPADEGRRARLRPHFLGLTLQSVKTAEAVALPFPAGAGAGLTPHVLLLKTRGRALGALCCACGPGDPDEQARRRALMEPIVRLVAQRIADVQEAVSSRATRAQYERWFRQLDSHIRTLDRERQKFAAVVNQSDVYIYVADSTRTIKWANRATGARFPAVVNGGNWVGRSCRDLCAHLGDTECNGTCPVARALEQNQAAHQEYEQESPDGKRTLYATALPIKGPEGRPQEVIVMLQDLSEIETVRRSEARYRALFEERERLELRLSTVIHCSPIVLFSIDLNGVFTLSVGRALEALGRAQGESVGQNAFEIYKGHPDIVANLRRALGGEEFTAIVQLGERSFETHHAPLRDAAGRITGMIGVATDITSVERARRAA